MKKMPLNCNLINFVNAFICLPVFMSVSCTLPLFEEICKRSARFLNKCIFSSSALVQSVILYCINFGCYNSLIYRNLCMFVSYLTVQFMILF